MAENFFLNVKKPTDTFAGRLMLKGMNMGHDSCAKWGLSTVDLSKAKKLLDIGCGGGKNISNLLQLVPDAQVFGIDYAQASVKASLKYNKKAVAKGRVEVLEADVQNIPYPNESFDGITAFETIYFWPQISKCFKEVVRTLKTGGTFFICNEALSPEGQEKWIKTLDMKVYTGKEIRDLMEQSGLSNIIITEHKNGKWLSVSGKKL